MPTLRATQSICDSAAKHALGFARRAELAAGKIVGVDPRNRNPRMGGAIAAARMSDAANHRAGTKTAVGAGIEKCFHLVGDDGAVALDAGFQPHHAGVARRAGDELFAIFHHHLHRPAAAQGEQIANRLVDGRSFAAEIAADGHWIDANFFLGKIEGRRHALLQTLRHFARRPHLDALLLVDPDQATMGSRNA